MKLGPARLQRALQLFDAALEQPESLRATWLADACAGDDDLRREVEAMLAADGAGAIDPLTPRLAKIRVEDDTVDLPTGTRIGAWELIGVLGRGGMGAVYHATRADGAYAQEAALKRIRIGLDNALARQRFLRERQILARLKHPHIAQLLDGGVDESGAPWFAMAHVEGERIDHWCDARNRPVRERVRLMLQVLDAVAFAHRQLVLHRDLKPSNILVDDNGHVTLLDFGIGKLIEEDDKGQTRTGETAFTPEYASPEQLHGEPVSTATDLYQLGVLMYALLANGHPYGVTSQTPLRTRLLQIEDNPKPLWEVALHASPEDAAHRSITPSALSRQLRGDLDAICQRCLANDPRQRYGSADALRDDLAAWLDGRAVSAHAPSFGYRAGRFLRRHMVATVATAAVVIALVAGLGVSLWQASIAKREAQHAQQVKNLVLSVFREQDPLSRSNPENRPPAKVIADGIHALDAKLANDPALHSELMDELGELQANVGDLQGGRATLTIALKERGSVHGEDSVEAAITARKLAYVEQLIGDTAAAEQHARRAIAIWARNGQPHSVEAMRAKLILSYVSLNRNNRDEAFVLAREAVDDLTRTLGPNDPETVAASFRQAQLQLQQGKYKDAEEGVRRVIARTEAMNGPDSARLVAPLTTLASLLRLNGQPDAAAAAYERVIALARRQFGDRHNAVAVALARYGALKQAQGEDAAALTLFNQAEAAMPDNGSVELSIVLANRGSLYMKLGQYDAAEQDFRRTFDLARKTAGDGDGGTWISASMWGRTLAHQGKLAEAERIQRESLSRLSRILGPDAYFNAMALEALAETLLLEHRNAEATELLQRSLALTARQFPTTHPVYRERQQRLEQIRQGKIVTWDVD